MSVRPLATAGLLLLAALRAPATEAPIALYTFEEAGGKTVEDRSGSGVPLPLVIEDPGSVERVPGELRIVADTAIRTERPAGKIIEAVKRSEALSVEVLLRTADRRQDGPARVVTISADSGARNFTLGQDGDRLDARMRLTGTSDNGMPSLSTRPGSLGAGWTHCVYTVGAGGIAALYLNGEREAQGTLGGSSANWDEGFRLALGNELTGDRPWRGALRRVAIYDRALDADEVAAMARASAPAPRAVPVAAPAAAAPALSEGEAPAAGGGVRSGRGLLALYDFAEPGGDLIRDRSGGLPPLDLKIGERGNVERSPGTLAIRRPPKIASVAPADRLTNAVRRSGAVTVEAWLRAGRPEQEGPARVVTLSGNTSERNFTLGQDGSNWDVRLRTTDTDRNGNPSLAGGSAIRTGAWTHVVYTRDRNGRTRLYVDGRQDSAGRATGNLTNWKTGWRLSLGDEHGGERRTWTGAYRLVAIYGRALSADEVGAHFAAGPGAATGDGPGGGLAAGGPHPNARRFHDQIAPLLSKHCLECHDSANQKGELDLSKRAAALASETFVPGKSGESELYLSVLEDEMPHKREPLAAAEKALLKQWIDDGAHWPLDEIDPLAHKRDGRAAQNWVRRLTVPEYIATVQATVGVDISAEAAELLPRDLRADGFSNTAYNLGVDLKHVEAYSRLAETIVSRMEPAEFAKRFSRNRQFTDKGMEDLLEKMGKWVLRGPLQKHEIIAYRGISTAVASAGGSFEEAVGLMLEAMLQSPRFIYQIERQTGGGRLWLDDYELAARMSYILWGASPDEELARAADRGELADPAKVRAQVGRMLDDPRAVQRSLQFAADWLHLDRLGNLSPDRGKFPGWRPELADDMRAETLAFFEEVVWRQRRPLGDLLNAQLTFATPRLADHYRLRAPLGDGAGSGEMVQVSLDADPARGGLLTQGSVLTIGGDDASTVTRGLFVLHDLLRSGVNDPPPGTDTTPVPSKPGLSQRMIAEQRVNDKACGGCHSKFEPLSYGLERFDGLGAYSEVDRYGNPLRHDGAILFPGEAEPVPYSTSAQLMDLLAGSERVRETITWKLAQFALGRPLGGADAAGVKAVHAAAQKQGGTYQAVVTELVLSDLVQTINAEE